MNKRKSGSKSADDDATPSVMLMASSCAVPPVSADGQKSVVSLHQDEVSSLEEKLRKLQKECSAASIRLSQTRRAYDGMLKKCETIKLLLSSYYNLEDADDSMLVPERGTPYWYIRATFGRSYFDVCKCEWIGGISDKFRYCRGNFFLDEHPANLVCDSCNMIMTRLRT